MQALEIGIVLEPREQVGETVDRAKLARIAAHMLGADPTEIRMTAAGAHHVPSGQAVPQRELIYAAYAGRSSPFGRKSALKFSPVPV